jgi:hypothetical protein
MRWSIAALIGPGRDGEVHIDTLRRHRPTLARLMTVLLMLVTGATLLAQQPTAPKSSAPPKPRPRRHRHRRRRQPWRPRRCHQIFSSRPATSPVIRRRQARYRSRDRTRQACGVHSQGRLRGSRARSVEADVRLVGAKRWLDPGDRSQCGEEGRAVCTASDAGALRFPQR